MEIYENNFLILMYNKKDSNIKEIIKTINDRIIEIANFFGITQIKDKIKIKIYYSQEEFQKYLIPFLYDGKYYDWMIASTHDGNINILSLDNCRQTNSHKDMNKKEYIDIIIHEFVHKFHQLVKGDNKTENAWFHEALATNLSNEYYDVIPISCTLDELKQDYNSVDNRYDISYTIGKYLLENYPHNLILSMCKDEKILEEQAKKIFEEAKLYSQEYLADKSSSSNRKI
ncbi:MAG: hypothetical protein IJE89_05980 [Bacilli bacterium]|nr:hypothetical protein [Bacilli bacterium]